MNDELDRQFIDTNILVYAYDAATGQKHETAKALLRSLWKSHQGALSIQVLQEFYVTVTRKVASPYSAHEAANIVEELGTWHVHTPAVADVLAAIKLQMHYQLSFWDAMLLHSATALGCGIIWTEDLSHGQMIHQTTIRNPFLQ